MIHSKIAVRKTENNTYYWPEIRYRYRVQGQWFSGARWRYRYVWRFDGFSNDRTEVQRAHQRYPVGRQVQVAYNPQDLGQSVLEPGICRVEQISAAIKVALMAGALLLLLAGMARLMECRSRRRARQAICLKVPAHPAHTTR